MKDQIESLEFQHDNKHKNNKLTFSNNTKDLTHEHYKLNEKHLNSQEKELVSNNIKMSRFK